MSSPLVSARELAAEPGEPVLLDVRWRLGGPPGLDSYREGHLPGAVFVDLDRDLAGAPGAAGRHPLPGPAAFQAAMRAAGVSQHRPVVVYDDQDATAAARGWWLLRYHGHENVRVLDGGYQAWLAAGLPVSTADPAGKPGDFTARPGCLLALDAADAGSMAQTGLLLDARTPERYRGERELVDPVAGHIPGARNRFHKDNLQSDGRFRSVAELRAAFAPFGEATSCVHQCGSGVTACHNLLAMEHAGLTGSALYPGSWSEWSADPSRPIARGG